MNDNTFYVAYADSVLNTCAFCSYLEYIADCKKHYCMLRKIEVLPEQPACAKRSALSKNSQHNK